MIGLLSVSREVVEQIILETVSKHIRDKKMIRSSQHGLMKVKLCMMNLIRGPAWWLREEQWTCLS